MDNDRLEEFLCTLRGTATRRGVLAAVAGVVGLGLSETTAKRRSGRKQQRGTAQVSAAGANHQPLTIATDGAFVGGRQIGTFTATGAIDDEGTFAFAEDLHRYFAFAETAFGEVVRSAEFFDGEFGMFTLQNRIKISPSEQEGVLAVDGTWTVLSGTGEYARLHGQGTIAGTIDETVNSVQFLFTFTGTAHYA